MKDLRIIFARVQSFPENKPSLYGAEIILDDELNPLGMRYWSNQSKFCGFCGSLEGQCTHGPFIDQGIMIAWDVRFLSRRIISTEFVEHSEVKWWKFNEEAKKLVNTFISDQLTEKIR